MFRSTLLCNRPHPVVHIIKPSVAILRKVHKTFRYPRVMRKNNYNQNICAT
nr:MAG TPA: hypothetical protein [Caudoviricetes sp.]